MAAIKEDYCDFETAKLLKEKGFDVPCNCYGGYDGVGLTYRLCITDKYTNWNKHTDTNIISCPTLQMSMRWLREMHNLFIEIQCYGCEADKKAHFEYSYVISEYVKINTGICTVFGLEKRKAKSRFSSYEEACEEAIKYCLEHLI